MPKPYDISATARSLVQKFKTRDPFELADNLGIHVMFTNDLTRLKGMYWIVKRERFIAINSRLPKEGQLIVCGHEVGHDLFHQDLAKAGAFKEFMLYDMTTRPEYEANVFAASFLLDEDRMLELIYQYHYDAEQIAKTMNSDINLVALKAAELARDGYRLNALESRADFLK